MDKFTLISFYAVLAVAVIEMVVLLVSFSEVKRLKISKIKEEAKDEVSKLSDDDLRNDLTKDLDDKS